MSESGEVSSAAAPTNNDNNNGSISELEESSTSESYMDETVSQLIDGDNKFYKTLCDGFHTLREIRENKKKPLFSLDPADATSDNATLEDNTRNSFLNYVTVNFIDPTTKASSPSSSSSSLKTNNMLASQLQRSSSGFLIEDVYDKLTLVFERDFGSKLRSIPYQRMRSASNETISSLPVRPVLTKTHAVGANANGGANVPWGGTAGTAAAPMSDPSEWHTGPYCHVYIAACESADHYRSKVRPSVQAFVSQIEAAATKARQGNSPDGSQPYSAHYLIVYIPTGPKTAVEESDLSSATNRVGTALASRIQKARQRIAGMNSNNTELSNDSHHSIDTLGSGDIGSASGETDTVTVVVNMLTKSERDIYKRLQSDFPNGKICVMSISSLDTSTDDESVSSTTMAIKTQEWSAFNRMLGSVIVNGFKDRCRRYNDELRRLDAQRAAAMKPVPKNSSKSSKRRTSAVMFNLSYFFLVKESLAFTYEQMQLPSEALLQYEEFRAFLPDTMPKDTSSQKLSRKTKKRRDSSGMSVTDLADAGDCAAFRRSIRSETDLAHIADVMERYLFARELSLLFKMEDTVEVINRCRNFVRSTYLSMTNDLDEYPIEERYKREIDAAKWAVKFCWDVKCASDAFLTLASSLPQNFDTMSIDTPGSDSFFGSDSGLERSEKDLAKHLSALLEIARLFMKKLGDTELDVPNPIATIGVSLPADIMKPWEPWQPVEPVVRKLREAGSLSPKNITDDPAKKYERSSLLDGAFNTPESYMSRYMEITSHIVALSRFAERRRMASRLQGEIAEIYIRRGEYRNAAAILKVIVKICRWDLWDRCHFWRVFRLAYCQRRTAVSTDYLKTLVTCFSPRISAIAPEKALCALQDDLEAVIGDAKVGDARYGKLAFIETRMDILETSSGESSMGTGPDRKKLIKRFCTVGDTVQVLLKLTSHLPRKIVVDSLKLFIVSYATFSSFVENRESVEEEDAFQILPLATPIEVHPGVNTFHYEWLPACAGQYVLSTVELKWKQGYFYYDSMDLEAPLLGIDVLPSDPTHSISIDPEHLIPDHDQQIRITFNSGTDFVTGGKITLTCNGGFEVFTPGENSTDGNGNWSKKCEVELQSCRPGENVVLTSEVKFSPFDDSQDEQNDNNADASSLTDSSQSINAKALTTYFHTEHSLEDNPKLTPMRTVQEATATATDKTALTIESITATVYKVDQIMILVSLVCNTLNPFTVEKWDLFLPPPLLVADDGDLNQGLINSPVIRDDRLSLAFACVMNESQSAATASDEPLLEITMQDDTGKSFKVDLPLDLNDFYMNLWQEEIVPSLGSVSAELKISSVVGPVGKPVEMTFEIDVNSLNKLKPNNSTLAFSIVCEEMDWIMGGKISGLVENDVGSGSDNSKKLSLPFIGIPTHPGAIKDFPILSLAYESDGQLRPLTVLTSLPEVYKSQPALEHVAIAYPASAS